MDSSSQNRARTKSQSRSVQHQGEINEQFALARVKQKKQRTESQLTFSTILSYSKHAIQDSFLTTRSTIQNQTMTTSSITQSTCSALTATLVGTGSRLHRKRNQNKQRLQDKPSPLLVWFPLQRLSKQEYALALQCRRKQSHRVLCQHART